MTRRNTLLMYSTVLTALLSLSALECAKKQSAGAASEKPPAVVPATQTGDISPELTARLKTVFADSQFAGIAEYQRLVKGITDSVSFAKAYRYAGRLSNGLSPALGAYFEKRPDQNTYDIDIGWMAPALPGLVHGIYAEGTTAAFDVDLDFFRGKAAGICPQFADFYRLLSLSYGGNNFMYPAWELRDWDNGGANALGNGVHFRVLSLIDTILPKCGIFRDEITGIRAAVLKSIIEGSDLFGYYDSQRKLSDEAWQARIQEEIGQILASINLTAEERSKITQRKSEPFPAKAKITG
jgi:hypothetical protein